MVLALVCMIVGVVFYGYIIASSAASLANADVKRSRYQQRLDTINRFLQVSVFFYQGGRSLAEWFNKLKSHELKHSLFELKKTWLNTSQEFRLR